MRIGKRIFPYPIINNQKMLSTYEKSDFELKVEVLQNDSLCILKNIHYVLDDEYIIKMIHNNNVKVYCIAECSSTVFRKVYELSTAPCDIEIPLFQLREKVSLSAYGIAMNDIKEYSTDSFDEDYKDYSFNINKYDILLIDDGFTFNIDYDENEDNKISSIFSVIKDLSPGNQNVIVSPTPRKIVISVPESQFDKFDNMKQNDNVKNLFFSILIIPALTSVLNKIQSDTISTDEYTDIDDILINYSWFKSIMSQYKNIKNYELTLEEFKQIDVLELSQELMDYPMVKGIDEAYQLTFRGVDSNDD